VFLAEPQVIAVVADAREAVGLDEGAVQDDVRHSVPSAAVQDVVQVWSLLGEDVDAFVQVAVAGGLGDARVAGQAVHASPLTEPAQDQHGLAERAQRPRSPRGAKPPPMGGQQPGQVVHDVARDIERGNIGDQREASGGSDKILW
jgi:hypothetical protein